MGVLRYLFSPAGRLDRRGYLLATLGWLLWLMVVQKFVVGFPDFATSGRILNLMWDGDQAWGPAMDAAVHASGDLQIRYGAFFVLLVVAFASFLALTGRRLHDIGRPARYAWIAALPFLGPQAVFYVLLFLPGDEDANRYGHARGRGDRPADETADLSHQPTSP